MQSLLCSRIGADRPADVLQLRTSSALGGTGFPLSGSGFMGLALTSAEISSNESYALAGRSSTIFMRVSVRCSYRFLPDASSFRICRSSFAVAMIPTAKTTSPPYFLWALHTFACYYPAALPPTPHHLLLTTHSVTFIKTAKDPKRPVNGITGLHENEGMCGALHQ